MNEKQLIELRNERHADYVAEEKREQAAKQVTEIRLAHDRDSHTVYVGGVLAGQVVNDGINFRVEKGEKLMHRVIAANGKTLSYEGAHHVAVEALERHHRESIRVTDEAKERGIAATEVAPGVVVIAPAAKQTVIFKKDDIEVGRVTIETDIPATASGKLLELARNTAEPDSWNSYSIAATEVAPGVVVVSKPVNAEVIPMGDDVFGVKINGKRIGTVRGFAGCFLAAMPSGQSLDKYFTKEDAVRAVVGYAGEDGKAATLVTHDEAPDTGDTMARMVEAALEYQFGADAFVSLGYVIDGDAPYFVMRDDTRPSSKPVTLSGHVSQAVLNAAWRAHVEAASKIDADSVAMRLAKAACRAHLYDVVEDLEAWMVTHDGKAVEPRATEAEAWAYAFHIVDSLDDQSSSDLSARLLRTATALAELAQDLDDSDVAPALIGRMLSLSKDMMCVDEDDNVCSDCGAHVDHVIGCPDGSEVCQACFDKGDH